MKLLITFIALFLFATFAPVWLLGLSMIFFIPFTVWFVWNIIKACRA